MSRNAIAGLVVSLIAMACAFRPEMKLSATQAQATPAATQSATGSNCPSPYAVAYRVMAFDGIKAAVWYPTSTAETAFAYSKDIATSLAKDGQVLTTCGTFP